MNELGLDINHALKWFNHESEVPYVLIRVSSEHATEWPDALRHVVRRCYVSDETLAVWTQTLKTEPEDTFETRQAEIIKSKLPDPGSTMAGDFGEILIYIYQATNAIPLTTIGPKKWRLKQDRTKPAPCSDVVQFILPAWPIPSDQDEILCAEVKMKSTNGTASPIEDAINGCAKDRTSRLSRTLQWLKERAMTENLGEVQIAHLNRFINATDYPAAIKHFRAVAVICSTLVDAEILKAPQKASSEYQLVVLAVPNLYAIYNAVFESAKGSTLPPSL